MQRRLIVALMLLLGLDANAAEPKTKAKAKTPDRNPESWIWVNPEKVPGMVHATLESTAMKRPVGFNVYLPPGYAQSRLRYPVVYYLHGASGSEKSAAEFGDVVKKAIADKSIGEVIYVFPNGGQYGGYRDWADGKIMVETFIIQELIPHIDKTYRTIASREGRALCGWSMGGGGSLRFAMKYPEKFCAAASFSAAIGMGESVEESAASLAARNADAVRKGTGLYMVVGESDSLFERHKPFLQRLASLNIKYTFKSQPGVGHNLGRMKELYGAEAVQMLARHYAPARE